MDVPRKVRIGDRLTRGLGVGGNPELGREAAEESREDLYDLLSGTDLVFVAAGMGGGTGTGAAPAIADIASEQGALTVGVVTSPFTFEGTRRGQIAAAGIEDLSERVDALIVVHNDRLLKMSDPRMGIGDAFVLADEMLQRGVQGITDLILTTGIVNVDFADVRAVMTNAGPALMGVGAASGDDRAIAAVNEAMHSPLLETSIEEARGVLLNVTASEDVTLVELNTAAQAVADVVADDANIIFGSVIDPRLAQGMRITLIATGCRAASAASTAAPGRRLRRRVSRASSAPGKSPFTVVPTPAERDEAGAAGR
jgi:cell division protein FtsZ